MSLRIEIRRQVTNPPPVNPGFLAKDRPLRYALTQEAIVPKEAVYPLILDRLESAHGAPITLVEFGFGTGGFLLRALQTFARRGISARCIGFDLSNAMGDYTQALLKREAAGLLATAGDPRIEIELITGVNCLDQAFTPACLDRAGGIDYIVQMQFSQYAPNAPHSPLGRATEVEGFSKLSKAAWLQRVWQWLRPGGCLFDFNDFDASEPDLNQRSLQSWDAWVLDQLNRPEARARIANAHPTLARSLAWTYPRHASRDRLLHMVAQRRELRRRQSREEVATLQSYTTTLEKQFGQESIRLWQSPLGPAHERFHLFRATRQRTTGPSGAAQETLTPL